MLPTVEESLESLFASASFLDSLPFQATKGRIADTALAPAEVFEGTYIRDAEEHELGLFSTEESTSYDGGIPGGVGGSSSIDHQSMHDRDDRSRHRRSLLGRSTGGSSTSRNQHIGSDGSISSRNAWNFPKSRGPARIGAPEKATPLKKRRAQNAQNKAVADPEAYLIAARKLLQTYPMQRASEHVELLYSQYEGLMDAIADLEETLHQPEPKASTSARTLEASADDDLASLEAEIKREELEILALKEARRELDREAKGLNGKVEASNPARQGSRTFNTTSQTARVADIPSAKHTKLTRQQPSSASATASAAGKRMPSVVARRMAEQKEAAAARSKLTKTPSPPPPATLSPQKDTSTSKLPEVNVQSPSNSSAIPPDEPEDEDQTIVISKSKTNTATGLEKDKADEAQSDIQTPPKRKLQPRLPPEQFDKILAKIISALPGNMKRNVTRDAESVLSALTSTISQAEARVSSPTSSISTASVLGSASPTSSSSPLTPVNIIEMYLLHTFLSLLLSLELEVSTNSREKLNLILRKSISSNGITSSSSASSPSSTASSATTTAATGGNPTTTSAEAFLNMNNLKIYLSNKSKEKGFNEDLGHKAIYGLVAKRILKIDRKGREALIGFI